MQRDTQGFCAILVPLRPSDSLNIDDTQENMPGILHSKIALFIFVAGASIFQSPNQSPERNAGTGPAVLIGASPLHRAFSVEESGLCRTPRG